MATWWCTSCGGQAEAAAASLDPAHPLGYCIERPRPCKGRLPLTGSLAELDRVRQSNRLASARTRHREHMGPRGKLVMSCTYCLAMYQESQQRPAGAPAGT